MAWVLECVSALVRDPCVDRREPVGFSVRPELDRLFDLDGVRVGAGSHGLTGVGGVVLGRLQHPAGDDRGPDRVIVVRTRSA